MKTTESLLCIDQAKKPAAARREKKHCAKPMQRLRNRAAGPRLMAFGAPEPPHPCVTHCAALRHRRGSPRRRGMDIAIAGLPPARGEQAATPLSRSPMSRLRSLARLAVLGAVAMLATPSLAETPIKFSLDWKFEGPAAPFLMARDKGYFKDAGLKVTIDSGSGSVEPLNRVASGTYDMGFGDINSLIKFVDANPGVPLKAVYMLYNKPPFAVVGRKSLGIDTPKDLEGKKLGAPAADGAFAQWKIFVQANDIDASKVKIENIGFPVREPMLAAGQVDAITGFSFSSVLNLKSKGVGDDDLSVFLMADYGVDLYGNAIFVNPKFAAKHPEAVKAFLGAFNKALKETVADPDAAIAYVLAANPIVKKEAELERLNLAINQNIVTDEVKEDGLGAIDPVRLGSAIDQIGLTYSFKAKPTADSVFDASYLPPAEERTLD